MAGTTNRVVKLFAQITPMIIALGLVGCRSTQVSSIREVDVEEGIRTSKSATEGVCPTTPPTTERVTQMMADLDLLGPVFNPAKNRWEYDRHRIVDGICVVVVKRTRKTLGEWFPDSLLDDVVVMRQDSEREWIIVPFETAFQPPASLRVGIGQFGTHMRGAFANEDATLYFAELTGDSVISAMKAWYGKLPRHGLMAKISAANSRIEDSVLLGEPDGKLDWDPNQGRRWKLKDATFDIQRGNTFETLDVYAYQLDVDFDAYYSGSNGAVGPWNSALIKVFDPNLARWVNVFEDHERPRF